MGMAVLDFSFQRYAWNVHGAAFIYFSNKQCVFTLWCLDCRRAGWSLRLNWSYLMLPARENTGDVSVSHTNVPCLDGIITPWIFCCRLLNTSSVHNYKSCRIYRTPNTPIPLGFNIHFFKWTYAVIDGKKTGNLLLVLCQSNHTSSYRTGGEVISTRRWF